MYDVVGCVVAAIRDSDLPLRAGLTFTSMGPCGTCSTQIPSNATVTTKKKVQTMGEQAGS